MHHLMNWGVAAGLMIALAVACGSSKPATEEAKPTQGKRAHADPTDFCERYSRMYCRHASGENSELVETSFEKLNADEQAAVLDACNSSYSAASEAEIEAMESCLGGIQSCDATESCITR